MKCSDCGAGIDVEGDELCEPLVETFLDLFSSHLGEENVSLIQSPRHPTRIQVGQYSVSFIVRCRVEFDGVPQIANVGRLASLREALDRFEILTKHQPKEIEI